MKIGELKKIVEVCSPDDEIRVAIEGKSLAVSGVNVYGANGEVIELVAELGETG